MLYKSIVTEMKANTESNTITGHASMFGNIDAHKDIVLAGAYKKTIQENKDRIKLLWQHDVFEPIGKPTHLQEDSKGLYFEAKISNTETGKKAITLIRDGVLNEMSIGYNVIKDDYDTKRNARLLKEIQLFEISIVSFASNEKATINGIKGVEHLLYEMKNGKFIADRIKIQEAIKALEALLIDNEPSKLTQNNEKSLDVIDDIDPNLFQLISKEIEQYK